MNKLDQPKYFTRTIGYGLALIGTTFFGYILFMIVEAFANW